MTTTPASTAVADTAALIDRSCRFPLLLLFTCASLWLALASVFGLVVSIKFHSPDFLAGSAWLTYGRLRPACVNVLLYGFGVQAGLGLGIWLLARLGEAALRFPLGVVIGGLFLNLGVAAGLGGILAGDGTGFESLEFPGYAAPLVLIGYVLIALPALLTFHARRPGSLFPSQWFLLAALFWFPWIYSTAELLLVTHPVRGVAQAVVSWWYSQNLVEVWAGLVGIAAAFYFVSVFTGRNLHSRYLALTAFWILILFASWAGVPPSAPVPAWMPALSSAARVVGLVMVIAVALNIYFTAGGVWLVRRSSPPFSFVLVSVAAFLLSALMGIGIVFWDHNQLLQFSWFTPARFQLQLYGFFVMICLGGIYHVVPRLAGLDFPRPQLVRLHFWLALSGLALVVLPFAAGGFLQARKMANPATPFVDIARATLPFLRASTIGDLLLLAGHGLLVGNLLALVARLCRARLARSYETATEDLFKSAEAKA